MSKYVEQNLNRHETLIKKAELNPIGLIVTCVFRALWIIVAIVLLVVANKAIRVAEQVAEDPMSDLYYDVTGQETDEQAKEQLGDILMGVVEEIATPVKILAIVILVFQLFKTAVAILRYVNTEFGLTDKRLIGKLGVINTESMDAPLDKVQNVSVSSGLFGKIFNYGKITVSMASFDSYTFKLVKDVDEFKRIIMRQVDLVEEQRAKEQAKQLAMAMAANDSVKAQQ